MTADVAHLCARKHSQGCSGMVPHRPDSDSAALLTDCNTHQVTCGVKMTYLSDITPSAKSMTERLRILLGILSQAVLINALFAGMAC